MVHVRTDSHASPTSISAGASFLRKRPQLYSNSNSIYYYRYLMRHYISGEKSHSTSNWVLGLPRNTSHATHWHWFDRHVLWCKCTAYVLLVTHEFMNSYKNKLEPFVQSLWCLVSYQVIAYYNAQQTMSTISWVCLDLLVWSLMLHLQVWVL